MRKEYYDPDIERQVRRLKAVIELGRYIRDKRTLKVKVRHSVRLGSPLMDRCLLRNWSSSITTNNI